MTQEEFKKNAMEIAVIISTMTDKQVFQLLGYAQGLSASVPETKPEKKKTTATA